MLLALYRISSPFSKCKSTLHSRKISSNKSFQPHADSSCSRFNQITTIGNGPTGPIPKERLRSLRSLYSCVEDVDRTVLAIWNGVWYARIAGISDREDAVLQTLKNESRLEKTSSFLCDWGHRAYRRGGSTDTQSFADRDCSSRMA